MPSMDTKQQAQHELPSHSPESAIAKSATTENLYVVTENGEQCFMWRANQLTYIAQDRKEIPSILASKFGQLATKLDLSFNSLTSFKYINSFVNLNELILDNNCLSDDQLDFRQNLRLKTLSLNKNKLIDLYRLINSIKTCFPNLEYLSLIGNPLCPGSYVATASNDESRREANNGQSSDLDNNHSPLIIEELIVSEQQRFPPHDDSSQIYSLGHQKYRHFIIYHLPNLRFLDSSPISERERDEALRRCFWMNSNQHRPDNHQTPLQSSSGWQSNEDNEEDDDESNDESTTNNGSWHRIPLNTTGALRQKSATTTTTATASRINELESVEQQQQQYQLTIMSTMPPLSEGGGQSQRQIVTQPKGVFSRLVYKYTGKNSEGNRFIRNQDL